MQIYRSWVDRLSGPLSEKSKRDYLDRKWFLLVRYEGSSNSSLEENNFTYFWQKQQHKYLGYKLGKPWFTTHADVLCKGVLKVSTKRML